MHCGEGIHAHCLCCHASVEGEDMRHEGLDCVHVLVSACFGESLLSPTPCMLWCQPKRSAKMGPDSRAHDCGHISGSTRSCQL